MRIRVLGSAAGGGVPQWNCACRNCEASRSGKQPPRSVASLAVSGDEARWIFINASCDISSQIRAATDLRPRATRRSPVGAVLLTDANIDHTAGLLEFRQAENFRVYSTALVKNTLSAGPMFGLFDRAKRAWHTFDAEHDLTPVDVAAVSSLQVAAIPVPGLLPSYAGAAQLRGATVAYRIEHAGARAVYAPIFAELDHTLLGELRRADAVFLDGTCWSDDEMIKLGLSTRTSRAMGHAPISGEGGSLERVRRLTARWRCFTHVNNTNPILDPASAASLELREAGFAVVDDGWEITL